MSHTPEEKEALDAWFAEQANPSPFAIEFEKRLGIYPTELHLVALQVQKEEDARIFEACGLKPEE